MFQLPTRHTTSIDPEVVMEIGISLKKTQVMRNDFTEDVSEFTHPRFFRCCVILMNMVIITLYTS